MYICINIDSVPQQRHRNGALGWASTPESNAVHLLLRSDSCSGDTLWRCVGVCRGV